MLVFPPEAIDWLYRQSLPIPINKNLIPYIILLSHVVKTISGKQILKIAKTSLFWIGTDTITIR